MPRVHQAHKVSIARVWSDDWQPQEAIYCEGFTQVAGPDVSEAVLTRHYGELVPPGGYAPEERARLEIDGYYIKVELEQHAEPDDEAEPIVWYGVVIKTLDNKAGAKTRTSETDRLVTGTQRFICRGLEFLLHRTYVDSSWVQDSTGAEIQIGRAIAFNLGPGRSTDHVRKGNKSPGSLRGSPIFAFDLGEHEWNVWDILNYLLDYHPPRNKDDEDVIGWIAGDEADAAILTALRPTAHAQGKTVFQLLNELIDRRRLVGYTINVIGPGPTMRTALTIPGGVSDAVARDGGTVIVDEPASVTVDALHTTTELKFAKPAD